MSIILQSKGKPKNKARPVMELSRGLGWLWLGPQAAEHSKAGLGHAPQSRGWGSGSTLSGSDKRNKHTRHPDHGVWTEGPDHSALITGYEQWDLTIAVNSLVCSFLLLSWVHQTCDISVIFKSDKCSSPKLKKKSIQFSRPTKCCKQSSTVSP